MGSRMAASQPVVEAPLQLTQQRMSRAVSKSAIRDKMVALPICGLCCLRRHSRQQGTNDRVIAGHVAALDDWWHQGDQRIKRTGAQSHGAAEKGAGSARSFPHHVADVAPQPWSPGNP
jgi:hypothetical protein